VSLGRGAKREKFWEGRRAGGQEGRRAGGQEGGSPSLGFGFFAVLYEGQERESQGETMGE